jgi:uncharacterized protein (TIGR00288 family)
MQEQQDQVAVFIDFENVAISAQDSYGRCELGVIMEAAEQWGRCIIKRAYGDWTRFSRYSQDLLEHAIESIQLFHYGAQRSKNAADIQMVVDTLEIAFTHPDIDVFVLVTGDSDFSAVARKLRERGKLVVGMGLRQATSEVLVKACDRFMLYDTLIEPETRTIAYGMERSRQLLMDAMRGLARQAEGGKVLATRLKQTMLKEDPTFNELTLGFQQFLDFLEAQSDLVDTSRRDKQLFVTLKPSLAEEPVQDETLKFRTAIYNAGLRLLDPRTRVDILQDLFRLLAERPGTLTLEGAILQLKAQYDAANILRSREEVQEVAKLVRYADVLDSKPESWELDTLTLNPRLQLQDFVDQCESAYVAVLLQKNLTVKPDLLALLLFGTSDQRARVEHLMSVVQNELFEGEQIEQKAATWEFPHSLRKSPELQIALRDLKACISDGDPSLEKAAELNREGLVIRVKDFEQARGYFLRAAKMMYDLLNSQVPGASLMDLEWYLASYCAAAAGANFSRYIYPTARDYYLAFFVLARETEPVWEKLQNLIPPMLSFYFTTAANENGEKLQLAPGRTPPERMAIELYNSTNPKIQERWLQLAQDLARANPTLLRAVVQKLDVLEKEQETPGTRETREALAKLIQAVGPGTREEVRK